MFAFPESNRIRPLVKYNGLVISRNTQFQQRDPPAKYPQSFLEQKQHNVSNPFSFDLTKARNKS